MIQYSDHVVHYIQSIYRQNRLGTLDPPGWYANTEIPHPVCIYAYRLSMYVSYTDRHTITPHAYLEDSVPVCCF